LIHFSKDPMVRQAHHRLTPEKRDERGAPTGSVFLFGVLPEWYDGGHMVAQRPNSLG
jgi:hypothetical protein